MAVLAWLNLGGGGAEAQTLGVLNFNNRVVGVVDALVFDSDGVTKLDGTAYLAGLFEGETMVGAAVPFRTGAGAGYINPVGGADRVMGVAAGSTTTVTVRAWESARGATYAQALAAGGKVGKSDPFQVVTGGAGVPPSLPANLTGLKSFRLGAASSTTSGTVNFNNRVAGVVDAPVFDTDGVTRLEGDAYMAGLFEGETMVGAALPFRSGAGAGYINPVGGADRVLSVAAGASATVTVRVWESARGGGYFEALSSGGKTGSSDPIRVVTGGAGSPPGLPGNLTGLRSFNLKVVSSTPRGTINFNNRVAGVVDAPIFDVDGFTRLEGTAYLAGLFEGETMLGAAVPFRTGAGAGYLNPVSGSDRTANVPAGSTAIVTVRVWESAKGANYAESVAAGGKAGSSAILGIVTGGSGSPPSLPANLIGLRSFGLGGGSGGQSNTRPIVQPVPDQFGYAGGRVSVGLEFSDHQTPAGSLTLSLSSSNPALLPSQSMLVSGSGGSRTLALVPAGNETGSSTVTVTVGDPGGLSSSVSFTLTVRGAPLTGNLTGSFAPDLLIQDGAGNLSVWTVAGGAPGAQTVLNPANPGVGWTRAFLAGDLNADGNGDIIFQNTDGTVAVWYMNGPTRVGGGLTSPSTPGDASWVLRSVGDFNNDRQVDLVFQHAGTGALAFWMMKGTRLESGQSANPSIPDSTGFLVVGAHDLNADGATDLVFQNAAGQLTGWLMQGLNRSRSVGFTTPSIPPAGRRVIAVADFDGDGKTETASSDGGTVGITPLEMDASASKSPVITVQPGGQSVVAGASINLLVGATGESLSFQWQLNGIDLPGAVSSSLLFLNIQPSQAGSYSVVVSNPWGSVTSRAAVVTVNSAPNTAPIISLFPDTTLLEDSSTTLSFTVGDTQTAASNLRVTVSSSNSQLLPESSMQSGGTGANRTLFLAPAQNRSGRADVTVTVSDGSLTVSDTFVLVVKPLNDRPAFQVQPSLRVTEDSPPQAINAWATGISPGAEDESGQVLEFRLSNDNATLFSVQPMMTPTGQLRFTPAANAFGIANVTVMLVDNGGRADGGLDTSTSSTFTIVLAEANDAPTFVKGADLKVAGSTVQRFVSWATGISAGPANESTQTLQFQLTSDNNSIFQILPTIHAPTGNLVFTPAANANGTAVVSVVLKDNGGTSNGGQDSSRVETFKIIVESNQKPTISEIANLSLNEDAAPLLVRFTVGDLETPLANLKLSVESSNPALLPPSSLVLGGSGASRTLNIRPVQNQSGSATVIVTVNDGALAVVETFDVNVVPVNDPPTFVKGVDIQLDEDSGVQTLRSWATGITSGAPNESGQILTISVTDDNGSLFARRPEVDLSGTLTFTPAPQASGQAIVTVIVRDDGGTANGGVDASEPHTFLIRIQAVNDPPVVSDVPDVSTFEDASPSVVRFAVGDVETPPSGLIVNAKSSNPALVPDSGLVLSGAATNRSLSIVPAPDQNGTAIITITVSDGGISVTDTFRFVVAAVNDPPRFTPGPDVSARSDSGPQEIINWATGIFAGAANEGSDVLTFELSGDNQGLFINQPEINTQGRLRFTPDPSASGVSRIRVVLRDNGGTSNGGRDASAEQFFDISVSASRPRIQFGVAELVVSEDGPSASAVLAVSKTGAGAASVGFFTEEGTAKSSLDFLRPAAEDIFPDFLATNGVLHFPASVDTLHIRIPISNDFIEEGIEFFRVRLSNPSEGVDLGAITLATVEIQESEKGENLKSITEIIKGNVASQSELGAIAVGIEDDLGLGGWKFDWENNWHSSGEPVRGLKAGPGYVIQFKPVTGLIHPVPRSIAVRAGLTTPFTARYEKAEAPLGELRVTLLPESGSGLLSWRLYGDTRGRRSGEVAVLPAGIHVVAFDSANGFSSPQNISVQVFENGLSQVTGVFVPDASPGGSSRLPQPIQFDSINLALEGRVGRPYVFNGQLKTPSGHGSGFIVHPRVVLTAAHVVFDDVSGRMAPFVEWFPQRHAGVNEPRPVRALGWFTLPDYPRERNFELQSGLGAPGVSTPRAQRHDVAAIYFGEDLLQGSHGGFLVSTPGNSYLESALETLLIGYPLHGPSVRPGQMHDVQVDAGRFVPTQDPALWRSRSFLSFPGNSGGSVSVIAEIGGGRNPVYIPAGVYLGSVGQDSLVRIIDSDVSSLIRLAAQASQVGTNSAAGGVIGQGGGGPGLGRIGLVPVTVLVGPPDAVQRGGGWGLSNQVQTVFQTGTEISTNLLVGAEYTMVFKAVAGYKAPEPRKLKLESTPGSVVLRFDYLLNGGGGPLPPVLSFASPQQLTLSGSSGFLHQIQFNPDLSNSAGWRNVLQVRLSGASTNVTVLLQGDTGFYRAVALP